MVTGTTEENQTASLPSQRPKSRGKGQSEMIMKKNIGPERVHYLPKSHSKSEAGLALESNLSNVGVSSATHTLRPAHSSEGLLCLAVLAGLGKRKSLLQQQEVLVRGGNPAPKPGTPPP